MRYDRDYRILILCLLAQASTLLRLLRITTPQPTVHFHLPWHLSLVTGWIKVPASSHSPVSFTPHHIWIDAACHNSDTGNESCSVIPNAIHYTALHVAPYRSALSSGLRTILLPISHTGIGTPWMDRVAFVRNPNYSFSCRTFLVNFIVELVFGSTSDIGKIFRIV